MVDNFMKVIFGNLNTVSYIDNKKKKQRTTKTKKKHNTQIRTTTDPFAKLQYKIKLFEQSWEQMKNSIIGLRGTYSQRRATKSRSAPHT